MSITPIEAANFSSTANKVTRDLAGGKRFVLAHFSDPHFARVDHIETSDLFNKRLLGFLRWKLKRRAEHSDELLTILCQDLQRTKPNHIAITGDLTQLGLPIEFQTAHDWLRTIGTAQRVTVIPGNHDTYVKTDWQKTFAHWLEYMAADGRIDPPKCLPVWMGSFQPCGFVTGSLWSALTPRTPPAPILLPGQ